MTSFCVTIGTMLAAFLGSLMVSFGQMEHNACSTIRRSSYVASICDGSVLELFHMRLRRTELRKPFYVKYRGERKQNTGI